MTATLGTTELKVSLQGLAYLLTTPALHMSSRAATEVSSALTFTRQDTASLPIVLEGEKSRTRHRLVLSHIPLRGWGQLCVARDIASLMMNVYMKKWGNQNGNRGGCTMIMEIVHGGWCCCEHVRKAGFPQRGRESHQGINLFQGVRNVLHVRREKIPAVPHYNTVNRARYFRKMSRDQPVLNSTRQEQATGS